MFTIIGLDVEFTVLNIPITFEYEVAIGKDKKKDCCKDKKEHHCKDPKHCKKPPFPPMSPYSTEV
ncbi:hypothetical protein A499_15946 [Niallia nealsonii AAU1]|nr:hypothetical protein A499_15946 [Niallia nealsonii AAU1]